MATIDGAIIGTPAYMSPEQARGKPVDKRTDIWAFGCVLYEMLTGRATFAGDTVADTIASVIEREPDWTVAAGRHARADPQSAARLSRQGFARPPARHRRRADHDRQRPVGIVAGAPIGAARHVGGANDRSRRGCPGPWPECSRLVARCSTWNSRHRAVAHAASRVGRFHLPDDQVLDGSGGAHVARRCRMTDRSWRTSRRRACCTSGRCRNNDPDAKPVPGTEAYKGVRDVGVLAGRRADRVLRVRRSHAEADAGHRRTDTDRSAPPTRRPASTGDRSDIVLFGQGRNGHLARVAEQRADRSRSRSVNAGEEAHGPQLLPDGDHFLFTIATGSAPRSLGPRRDRRAIAHE